MTSLADMRRELREKYQRLNNPKIYEVEECATCGEEKPVKYHLTEYTEPGIPTGPWYVFCSEECLCLYVKHYKCL